MNVYLQPEGRDELPADLIHRWVLRSDLAPVPRTVEMTLQIKEGIQERLAVGRTFWTGKEMLEYEVTKAVQHKGSAVVQGSDQLATFSITALLAPCARIAYRRDRAVVRRNTSLGELFRECGAAVAIGNDFPVDRFSCFVGQVPSIQLAKALQEEGAALVFRDKRLSVVRLADMMRQEPVDYIGQTDSTDHTDSEFLERHEIPAFFSTDDDGNFVFGDFSRTRAVRFHPRADERTLRNCTRVMVTRRVVDSRMAQQIKAGDVLDINGERLAVITAAHAMEKRQGVSEMSSRFWLGSPAR